MFDLRNVDDISMMCALLPPIDVLIKKTSLFDQLPQLRIDAFNRIVFAGRFAAPDEIAELIKWLALDAPEYVNRSCVDAASGSYLR